MAGSDFVLGQLGKFADGTETLRGFVAWFDDALWDLEDDLDARTMDAMYQVENRLAEYVAGTLPEDGLRRMVSDIALALLPMPKLTPVKVTRASFREAKPMSLAVRPTTRAGGTANRIFKAAVPLGYDLRSVTPFVVRS